MDTDSQGAVSAPPTAQEVRAAPVTVGPDASDAEILIGALGGLTSASRALGSPISTVQSWQKNRRVPRWHRAPALAAVRAAGKGGDADRLQALWAEGRAALAGQSETPTAPTGSAAGATANA